MEDIKTLRNKANMTQQPAADLIGISLRSFKDYENNFIKKQSIKYKNIVRKLTKHSLVDETRSVLSLVEIKDNMSENS